MLEYTLGEPDDASKWGETSLVEYDDEGRHYLRLLWAHGTICDVTGEPRRLEVQFHCCSEKHISTVREFAVCNYVMVIHTPLVCKLPWFLGTATERREKKESLISCQPISNHADDMHWKYLLHHSEAESEGSRPNLHPQTQSPPIEMMDPIQELLQHLEEAFILEDELMEEGDDIVYLERHEQLNEGADFDLVEDAAEDRGNEKERKGLMD